MTDNKKDIKPFGLEGLAIRHREKPIPETVPQSQRYVVDMRIAPQIFLNESKELFFRDNETKEPIPLSQIKDYYKRIRFVEGELRFYDRDLITFVTLSDIVKTQDRIRKTNSLIFSNTHATPAPVGFSALDIVKKHINEFTESTTSNISGFVSTEDLIEAREKFRDSLKTDILRFPNKTIIEVLFEEYISGLKIPKKSDADNMWPVKRLRAEFDCFVRRWVQAEVIEDLGCVADGDDLSTSLTLSTPVSGTSNCTWQSEKYMIGSQKCKRVDGRVYIQEGTTFSFSLAELTEEIPDILSCDAVCPSPSTFTTTLDIDVGPDLSVDTVNPQVIVMDWYNVETAPTTYCETCTFQNKRIFLTEEHIGFEPNTETDFDGRIAVEDQYLAVFENYLFKNLSRFNGIGRFINDVFGEKTPANREVYDSYFFEENGYTTISGGGNPATTVPTISGQGIFYGTGAYSVQKPLLENVAKVISFVFHTTVAEEFRSLFNLNGLITGEKFRKTENVLSDVDFDSYLDFIEDKFKTDLLFRADVITELDAGIDQAFSEEVTLLSDLASFQAIPVGGVTNIENYRNIDFAALSRQWFDIPNLFFVSESISNYTAISLTATFAIDLEPKSETRFEFRLYDSVTDTELDRVLIDAGEKTSIDFIGEINEEPATTYPIMLSYIGPTPPFVCNRNVYNDCLDKTLADIKSHVKLSVEDCAGETVIGANHPFRVIADRFLENIETQAKVIPESLVEVETPRIFRVQFRMIGDDSKSDQTEDGSKFRHIDNLSDLTFDSNGARSSEMRISLNVYNFDQIKGKRLLKQGQVKFNDQTRRSVLFDFATTFDRQPEYSISLQASKNINVWWENKSDHSFDIVAEKPFKGTVDWVVSQAPTATFKSQSKKVLPPCFVDARPGINKTNFELFNFVFDIDDPCSSE